MIENLEKQICICQKLESLLRKLLTETDLRRKYNGDVTLYERNLREEIKLTKQLMIMNS